MIKQVLIDTSTAKYRSHDTETSLDDFLNRLAKTQNQAEKMGWKIEIKEVTEKELWPI